MPNNETYTDTAYLLRGYPGDDATPAQLAAYWQSVADGNAYTDAQREAAAHHAQSWRNIAAITAPQNEALTNAERRERGRKRRGKKS